MRTERTKAALLAAVMAAGLGSVVNEAAAVTHTWTGAGTGSNTDDWSAKQNWSTNSTPAAQDTALFKSVSSGNSVTPTIDAAGQVVGIITFDSVSPTFTIAGANALSLDNSTGSAQINLTAANTANQVISAPLSLASDLAISNLSSASLSVSGIISGTGRSVTKSGTGTVILSGVNTYTGTTSVTGGALNLTGSGSINNSATVNLNGGSLSSAATFTRASGQSLMGQGSLTGTVNINNGATVQVGQTHGTAGTAGTLSVTGSTTFASGSALNIDLFSAASADKFGASATLTLNGTLNIANASGFSFAAGQSWDVLDWGSRSGTFSAVALPTLSVGLVWNQSALYTTGVLSIDSAATAGHYTLSASAAASRVIAGGSTNVTSTITNTGTGTQDSINYTGLTATDGTATITGAAGSGTRAQGQNAGVTQSFSSTTTGIHTVTPTATVTNTNLGGSATSDGTTSATVTVVAKRTVTGDTVNIGNVIGGTAINTTASVSTTGDNNNNTGVQVAGASSNTGNGLSASGSATNFTNTGSALRTISGNITGSGIVSGDLFLNVTTLENGGAGLAGEGSYSPTAIHYTANVLSHADARFELPGTGGTNSSYLGSDVYPPGVYTTITPDVSGDGAKALNVDFKYIYDSPAMSPHPYPVYAYFDISNALANAAGLHFDHLVFTPSGNSNNPPNWELQNADGTPFSFADLASNSVKTLRIAFDVNDPSHTFFDPYNPFFAQWDLYFTDASGVLGRYDGTDGWTSPLGQTYHLTINARAVAVPTPASVLTGLGLLGGLGIQQFMRSRRIRSEQRA